MDSSLVRSEIERAFSTWSRHANFNVKLVETGYADILIQFIHPGKGDGPGNTVAFAYFPVSPHPRTQVFYLQYYHILENAV